MTLDEVKPNNIKSIMVHFFWKNMLNWKKRDFTYNPNHQDYHFLMELFSASHIYTKDNKYIFTFLMSYEVWTE